MFELIVSQGRIADRKERTIEGALQTARMLEDALGLKGKYFGTPEPAKTDDWTISLPGAKQTLVCLQRAISDSIEASRTPIMVANTCSASLASLPPLAERYPEAILLWVDAHGDFNTPETTDSGYLGGMVLAAACGLWDSGHGNGLRPDQVILVGARDIDPDELAQLRRSGVRILPPEEATPDAVREAVGKAPVWIHVDWDVMEPGHIPADYSVPHGFLPKHLREIFEAIPSGQIVGLELAEFHAPLSESESRVPLKHILSIIEPLLEPEAVA